MRSAWWSFFPSVDPFSIEIRADSKRHPIASLLQWFRVLAKKRLDETNASSAAEFLAGRCAEENITDASDVGALVAVEDQPELVLIAALLDADVPASAYEALVRAAIPSKRRNR